MEVSPRTTHHAHSSTLQHTRTVLVDPLGELLANPGLASVTRSKAAKGLACSGAPGCRVLAERRWAFGSAPGVAGRRGPSWAVAGRGLLRGYEAAVNGVF